MFISPKNVDISGIFDYEMQTNDSANLKVRTTSKNFSIDKGISKPLHK